MLYHAGSLHPAPLSRLPRLTSDARADRRPSRGAHLDRVITRLTYTHYHYTYN